MSPSDTIAGVRNAKRILTLLVLFALPPLLFAAKSDSDPHLTASQLKQLRTRIDSIQGQIQQMRGQQDRAEAELRTTEKRISDLTRSIRKLDQDISEQQAELEQIGRQMQGQTSRLTQNRRALQEQVRSAYISGQEAYLKLLLNQRDPQQLGRMLVAHEDENVGLLLRHRSGSLARGKYRSAELQL